MAILLRSKTGIFGLTTSLQTLQENINLEAQARVETSGDLTGLETVIKDSLVGAINEVNTAVIDLGIGAQELLRKDDNLASVVDIAAARTNLEVLSGAEVAGAIEAAKLALGTNYTVDTLADRDLLEGLDSGDRVFVRDSGDGSWVLYKPTTFDAQGKGTGWVIITSQTAFESANSADAIKTAYESNADTNAYTDADQTKVGFISVTEAVNLDDAVLKQELEQNLSVSAPLDQAVSAAAVKAYADAAALNGGSETALETLVVSGDNITLTHAPKGGKAGIMNFAMVRYIDSNNVAYDAPVIATTDPKVFTISVDTSGEWNGFNVVVQYSYVPVV